MNKKRREKKEKKETKRIRIVRTVCQHHKRNPRQTTLFSCKRSFRWVIGWGPLPLLKPPPLARAPGTFDFFCAWAGPSSPCVAVPPDSMDRGTGGPHPAAALVVMVMIGCDDYGGWVNTYETGSLTFPHILLRPAYMGRDDLMAGSMPKQKPEHRGGNMLILGKRSDGRWYWL